MVLKNDEKSDAAEFSNLLGKIVPVSNNSIPFDLVVNYLYILI